MKHFTRMLLYCAAAALVAVAGCISVQRQYYNCPKCAERCPHHGHPAERIQPSPANPTE